MTFSHYILTRFNLPLSSVTVGGKWDVCGEKYLSYRFSLFERYCMPSVKNQTCQNFKWLILFDINTPESFKQRAAEWHRGYPNLVPCYLKVEDYGGVTPSSELVMDVDTDAPMLQITCRFVADIIRSLETSMPEWMLTTRLDSDDALHKDWIKNLQDSFKVNPRLSAFDFVYTYKYIPEEQIVYRYVLRNGHFITLAEPFSSDFRSVLFCNHLDMDKYVKVEHFYKGTFQTELIHSRNVVNGYTDLSIGGLLYALFHFWGRDFGYETVHYSRWKALWMLGSLIKQRLFY